MFEGMRKLIRGRPPASGMIISRRRGDGPLIPIEMTVSDLRELLQVLSDAQRKTVTPFLGESKEERLYLALVDALRNAGHTAFCCAPEEQ